MKKAIALITIVLLLMLGISNVILAIKSNKDRTIIDINDSKLAIMVQEEGTDNYVPWTNDTWPTDGYELNTEMSQCANNSNENISFDSSNGVIIDSNKSDRCTIYFDKAVPKSSFIIEDMDQSFYSHCSVQVSYDGGLNWNDFELSTNRGDITEFKEGTVIRVNNKDNYYQYCSIKICELSSSSICSISGDDNYEDCGNYSVSSGSSYGYGRKDYTIKGGNSYSYSLSYCTCLTGDNEIWVEEKKKRKKKKIFELKKGDKILTIDQKTGKIKARKVKEIRISKVNVICNITLDNSDIIRASMKHVFVEENLGDVMSDELKVGYRLQDALGGYHEITNIEIENYAEGIDVYTIIPEECNKITRIIISSLVLTGAFGSNVMLVYAAGCKT